MTLTVGLYVDSYPPVVDGVGICVKNYARWLNECHCKAYVAAPSAPDYTDDDPFPVYRFTSLPFNLYPPYRLGVPMLDPKFRDMELSLPPQLVHAHSPFTAGNAALRLSRKLDIPLITTFHSKYYDDFLQATKSDFLARRGVEIVVSFYDKADAVWTVNEATQETLRQYGYRGRVTIVGNGTDYDGAIDKEAAKKEVSQWLGIGDDERVTLFVGQMILQKNLMKVVESAAINKKRGIKYRQLLVGEGYAADELKRRAKELDAEDAIIFAGSVKDRELLKKIYARAELFTFPSVYDSAGIVIREAAAFCCPSVLVRNSNAAAGLSEGVNAFMCEDDATSIADAIAGALADKDALSTVGQGARLALARPWRDVVDEVYGNYTEVLDRYEKRRRRRARAKKKR